MYSNFGNPPLGPFCELEGLAPLVLEGCNKCNTVPLVAHLDMHDLFFLQLDYGSSAAPRFFCCFTS